MTSPTAKAHRGSLVAEQPRLLDVRTRDERTSSPPTASPALNTEELEHAIEHAAHLLPQQAPLHAFVHHNTLHHFEDRPFTEAVELGARVFGTEPYHSEHAYIEAQRTGRIRPEDLQAVVERHIADPEREVLPGGPSFGELLLERLRHEADLPPPGGLSWWRHESPALVRLHPEVDDAARRALLGPGPHPGAREREVLAALWAVLEDEEPTALPEVPTRYLRRRDHILDATGHDTDEDVHPLIIRFTGAFLDQGIAYWPLPRREEGLLASFRALYGGGSPLLPSWARGLPARLRQQGDQPALATIADALAELGVAEEDAQEALEQTLLALPGWPGMVRHLEERPDRAPVKAPPCRLVDWLAVRLTLDAVASQHALTTAGIPLPPDPPRRWQEPPEERLERLNRLRAEAFLAAQWMGIPPERLREGGNVTRWLDEIAALDEVTRRRWLHLAYERRHRVSVLDPLLALNGALAPEEPEAPSFQALFCIDEREESLRRHLEEIEPDVQTFGFAGFFGIPMSYLGLGDAHPRPLCPVVVTPKHIVVEKAVADGDQALQTWKPARAGSLLHTTSVSSRTLFRGSLITALLGLLEVIPLIGRVLFPRLSERFHLGVRSSLLKTPARTRLVVERVGDHGETQDAHAHHGHDPGHDHDHDESFGLIPGFSVEEMTGSVVAVLKASGLTRNFAPLVFVVGHGSSSLNNPHEAAHDCGACGGGRGGPNGRAFAIMANHPEVRKQVRERGIDIPDGTWFIGAYHNTADDAVDLYDLDLVPKDRQLELQRAKDALEEARTRDAQERARRFAHAPTPPPRALEHVEARAVDLGQPRPEYGHCTNAVCIVGRRALSRGLFLDRRAFLVSYDPSQDDDGSVLDGLLQAVGPVGAGINLEYYFSFIDNERYGCGTKLPHNITGLFGVMNGHASDLRTGLPWQMVEIHEPVRLLTIVEASPARLTEIAQRRPAVGQLVVNQWIQLIAWEAETNRMHEFVMKDGEPTFVPYEPEHTELRWFERSADYYLGHAEHLAPVGLKKGLAPSDDDTAEGGRHG